MAGGGKEVKHSSRLHPRPETGAIYKRPKGAFKEVTPPLATPDKNIRGQEGGDGGANYEFGKLFNQNQISA